MRDPLWSSLFLKDCIPWRSPMLEQFLKNCSLWEGPTLEKFVKDCIPSEGQHAGAGEECEKEGAAETSGNMKSIEFVHLHVLHMHGLMCNTRIHGTHMRDYTIR